MYNRKTLTFGEKASKILSNL